MNQFAFHSGERVLTGRVSTSPRHPAAEHQIRQLAAAAGSDTEGGKTTGCLDHDGPRAHADRRIAPGELRPGDLHINRGLQLRFVLCVDVSFGADLIRNAKALLFAGLGVLAVLYRCEVL